MILPSVESAGHGRVRISFGHSSLPAMRRTQLLGGLGVLDLQTQSRGSTVARPSTECASGSVESCDARGSGGVAAPDRGPRSASGNAASAVHRLPLGGGVLVATWSCARLQPAVVEGGGLPADPDHAAHPALPSGDRTDRGEGSDGGVIDHRHPDRGLLHVLRRVRRPVRCEASPGGAIRRDVDLLLGNRPSLEFAVRDALPLASRPRASYGRVTGHGGGWQDGPRRRDAVGFLVALGRMGTDEGESSGTTFRQ